MSSLDALKSLPCPAGDKCTAFQCLFNHEERGKSTVNKSEANAKKSTLQTSAEKVTPSSPGQDQPRKRIKLSPDVAASASQVPKKGGATKPVPRKENNMHLSATPEKKASPPEKQRPPIPTRQPTPLSQKGSGSTRSTGSNTTSASSSQATTPATRKPASTVTSAPKKPEALNPRFLQRAPAQHQTRHQLLSLLHQQYTRLNTELKKIVKDDEKMLVLSDQQLIVKALDDEQDAALKNPKSVYGDVLKKKIFAHKKMQLGQWKDEVAKAVKESLGSNREDAAVQPEPIVTGLNLAQEVDFLHRLAYPLFGMEHYGYVSAVPDTPSIEESKRAVETSGNIEMCDRCTRRFQVFPGRREEDGALASNGTCTHHPGKVYFQERTPGDRSRPQKRYRCCNQDVETEPEGCVTAAMHVFKTTDPNRLASLLNFAETPENPDVPADRAVCFDCEMGYTVYGMELIRLTAVSWPGGEELLDVLVQPYGEYMDLNTRYSGVTAEHMVTAERLKPGDDHRPSLVPPSSDPAAGILPPQRKLKMAASPKAARDLLFTLISPKTPLIGHGLENDLNAVRVVHPVCVDTVLLYPHKRGLPVRNGLKYLMDKMLGRKIQVENAGTGDGAEKKGPEGHDSAEDARAAGELVRLKVRDEWRTMRMKGWAIDEGSGEIRPPGSEEWTVVGEAKKK
ncbi:exonuclease [Xylariomycetidae sp. FL2044]|nr:exonuclease [Xylariomycetidae sp. FL2044]